METEEKEAMWEKLKQHEKVIKKLTASDLKIAINAANLGLTTTYNIWITTFEVWNPHECDAFVNYMKPKFEAVRKTISASKSINNVFKEAVDFYNDCLEYFKTHQKDS